MDNYHAGKSAGKEGKRDERGRQKPVRVHELLGIPKSDGKAKIVDGSIAEQQKSQPIPIKDLILSMSSCKKPNPSVSARRMTVAPAGTNARRQLYGENCVSPGKSLFASSGFRSSEKKLNGLIGNPGGRIKSKPEQLLGVSKSEGKNVKHDKKERQPPERMKDLLASWEKSQTVKQARKSIMGDCRTGNVRRKLYNVPSPKVAKKSLAPNKFQPHKISSSQRKSIKPEQKKTTETQSRKSCLLPPNSIRDQHLNRHENETIKEESPASLLTEKSTEATKILEETFEMNETITRKIEPKSRKKQLKESTELPRPTVIMSTSTKKMTPKSQSESPKSSDSKKSSFTLSRPPLQELKRDSLFPQHRLDAVTSSIEDLLGNFDNRESLPYNSFLEQPESTNKSYSNVEKQTLSWMHANLKLSIQSTEENLFSMKQMLRTLDDLLDKNSTKDEATVTEEIPLIKISEIEKDQNLEENKENVFDVENGGRRRSARLLALQVGRSLKNSDDSFSIIERELNIFHEKSKLPTPRPETPKERKKIDPRSRRSMREYMALKSMMNCLQTPDVNKGLPTPKGEKDTPSQRRANKRSLSRQLLNELDDLYADSPQ